MDKVCEMEPPWKNRIESDPHILRGKPCIKGTRIPVALILGYLAASKSTDQILSEFPDLTAEDVASALEYARDLADFEAVAIS
jgi:uncharacterized protein (DUF433 family)